MMLLLHHRNEVRKIEKAFKYRIYPNKKQQEILANFFGSKRFVYNHYLDAQMLRFENKEKLLSYNEMCKDLTSLKQALPWLKEADKCILQNTLKDLSLAYSRYFEMMKQPGYVRYSAKLLKHLKEIDRTPTIYDSCGHPKFKSKKNRYQSYKTSYNKTSNGGNIKFLGNKIQLPKLGYIRIRDKQFPQGRILNATISQEPNGHYYCSLCCTDVEIQSLPKTNEKIGIDLGITDFAIMSNKDKIANPRFYEQSEEKLAKLQRELSRKTIGGSNWNKSRIKVAKLQKHIQNQRTDFLHKLSTQIVKDYDIICIENLGVQEMQQTKLDTNKESQIRHKHIADVSWYEFSRQLEYKCKWYGKELRKIDQYYPSSQICHICGHNSGKKNVDVRVWKCNCCNNILDRDINAAINILNKGLE